MTPLQAQSHTDWSFWADDGLVEIPSALFELDGHPKTSEGSEAIAAQFSVTAKFSAFHASRNRLTRPQNRRRKDKIGWRAREAEFNWSERGGKEMQQTLSKDW